MTATRRLAAVGVLAFLSQLVPNLFGGYGYFIDELYYLACARRLAWGYVDHPPLSIFLLRGETAVLGTSVWAIRLLPALAGAALALLTGSLARRLGGASFAQGLAALAILAPPVLLVFFGFYSMNAFEPVLWLLAVLALVSLVDSGDRRRWLCFGLVAGLGLLNKHTMVLLGAAMLAGLLLTPERRLLASRWLWLAGLLALVIIAPNLAWQAQTGWPSLEFYRNAEFYKNLPTPPLTGLANQVLFMNPLALPLWLAGLMYLFASPAARRYRFLAWAYVLLLAFILASRVSRADRIAGIYPVLFAAGAVAVERAAARAGWGWVRGAALALVATGAVALAPLGLPVLPPAALARYVAVLGVVPQIEKGATKRAELPQWFADRFGWPELVDQVTRVVLGLPEAERGRAILLAPSYGQAGALELLGRGLPPVFSGHNTYFLWGLEQAPRVDPAVAIVLGRRRADLAQVFAEVEQVAVYRCGYCMPWRDEMPIHVAHRPRVRLAEVWPRLKHFE
jgi:hypothetical protein